MTPMRVRGNPGALLARSAYSALGPRLCGDDEGARMVGLSF
ncbi:hypothetical protein AYO29_08825 [Coxiella burnetii str. Schperling]|nr:hypothetical protein [Coxiella burnetii]ATN86878.1 hypothetical protein AYO29_08825 [Coxiella burnetii str. Schperling]PHH56623.1 hypothetical protein CRH12_09840 [Coxiella burnetii]